MLPFLTISSVALYILILRRAFSAQSLFFVSLIFSYQFILLASIHLSIPLDIFEDSDDPTLRFELAWMNILFFGAMYLGQLSESRFRNFLGATRQRYQSRFLLTSLFILLIVIAAAQIVIMPPRVFSGEYSNEKPGYYFEYFTIFFCLYFVKAEPKGFWRLLPFLAFCLNCILAGERLMLITIASAFIFYQKPYKINFKVLLYLSAALVLILQLDNLRSGSEGSGLINSFIFNEDVTHHGSLLYSTLVLMEYANNTPVSIHSLTNSFSFLFGLDQSTQGLGLAAEISAFGRRGGGGFLPGYLCLLFGNFFGPVATCITGFLLGILLQAHRQGRKLGVASLVFMAFAPHFIIYTPVLLLKPVFFAFIIMVFWSILNELQSSPKRAPHQSVVSPET